MKTNIVLFIEAVTLDVYPEITNIALNSFVIRVDRSATDSTRKIYHLHKKQTNNNNKTNTKDSKCQRH